MKFIKDPTSVSRDGTWQTAMRSSGRKRSDMGDIKCGAKHTVYNPPSARWSCPKCGADCDDFYINDLAEDCDPDCDRLHVDDTVTCQACGGGWSGTALARAMMKRDLRETCPTCKGEGTVPSKGKA